MPKKILPRVFAVVVVGLEKFRILTAERKAPWLEHEELPARWRGEALHHHAARLVGPDELRRAELVTINSKVIKSRISKTTGDLDQVAGQYGAVEGAPTPAEVAAEATDSDRRLAVQLKQVLGLNPAGDHTATEMLVMVQKLVAAKYAHDINQLAKPPAQLEAPRVEIGLKKRAGVKLKVFELEGDNLTVEQLGEALKIVTGGEQ